jgi:hypothetical protein
MRAKEFIIEAKPENLGQGQLYKLSSAAIKKNDAIDDGEYTALAKELADYIFKYVGPKYLIWTVNQYINDPTFSLNDIDTLQDLLTQFDTIKANPRVQMEKDLMKYKSIKELKKAIKQAAETVGTIGTAYFSKAVERINQLVKSGQADWLYKGNDYVIYHPKTFEASHMMSALISTTICTIMNKEYFDDYSAQGYLMYTIPNSEPNKLYNCFVNDSYVNKSEAADEQNNHPNGGSAAQIKHQTDLFPALLPLVKRVMTDNTDLNVLLMFTPPDQQYNQCLAAVQRSGWSLEFVPKELIDYNICLAAIKENGEAFQFVPEEVKDYKLCLAAVEFAGSFIDEIPGDLIDYKLCLAAVQNSPWALRYMFNHLPTTMSKKLTPEERHNLYLSAVEADGSAIEFGPEALRDYEICLTAIQNGGAMKHVPAPIRAKIQAGMR